MRLQGKKDPVVAKLNWTADLDENEYMQLLGLRLYEDELGYGAASLEPGN